ncbi:MAG: hypothetical protein ACRDIB_04435, partial [Ardenticatenaceae bacterium]
MKNASDAPWHAAKQRIGRELQELTMLWQVGTEKRKEANARGILKWSDPRCAADALGVKGTTTGPVLQAMLDVNQSLDGTRVRPPRIANCGSIWRNAVGLEFYVDFETMSDLDDDFSGIPEKGGQPLIFMIGCGHYERSQWVWECFTTERLSEECEAEIIDKWLSHMAYVKNRLDPDGDPPRVIHWSFAERSTLDTAFNSAMARHPDMGWQAPQWFDFLTQVIKAEPVVVRGAFGFGLKEIASAMHSHGCVQTRWESGPTDGLGAMVAAWWCAAEASARGCSLAEV